MNKKRWRLVFVGAIIFILMLTVIILVIMQLSGSKYKVKKVEEDAITRYEWIEMLCERVGMTGYEKGEPYFKDVNENNTYFAYVQSATEWNIMDGFSKFEGDSLVSGEYIAITAMRTINQEKLRLYLASKEEIKEESYINLAIEHNLIEEKQRKEGFSREECEQVLDTLESLYFGEFWKDDYADVKYQDGVVELSVKDVLQSNTDCSEIIVTQEVLDSLEDGTIIVFEQSNTKLKIARKIMEVDSDGTLGLEKVELEQVVESLVVSDITEVSFANIVNYYGLEPGKTEVNNLYDLQKKGDMIPVNVFPYEAESKGFKIALTTEEDEEGKKLKIDVIDNESGTSYTLPFEEEVDVEEEYSAEFNIDRFHIGGQVDYSILKHRFNYVDVAVDAHATMTGTMSCPGIEKKILLFETPAPLGNGFVGVNIQIYLIISVDGTISFEAELPMELSFNYEKEKGVRNFVHQIDAEKPTVSVNCDTELMLRVEPILTVLDCLEEVDVEFLGSKLISNVNIMDAEFDFGMCIHADTTSHPNSQICTDLKVAYPVIRFAFCNDEEAESILGQVGFDIAEDIVSPEDALFQFGLHFERLVNGNTQYVEKCTYNEEVSDNYVADTSSASDVESDDIKQSVIKDEETEITDVSNFYGYDLPLRFVMDYKENNENDNLEFSITDTGNYYLVKGSLSWPEVTNEAVGSDIGTYFTTVSGNGYTIVGIESYNEGQRQKILLLGDDGNSYEIMNIPAFFMDAYTGAPYYYITSKEGEINYRTILENVTLRIDYDVIFSDGKTSNGTFDDAVKAGYYEGVTWGIGFDIHFSEDGRIDIFTTADFGSNGMEAMENTVIWNK